MILNVLTFFVLPFFLSSVFLIFAFFTIFYGKDRIHISFCLIAIKILKKFQGALNNIFYRKGAVGEISLGTTDVE